MDHTTPLSVNMPMIMKAAPFRCARNEVHIVLKTWVYDPFGYIQMIISHILTWYGDNYFTGHVDFSLSLAYKYTDNKQLINACTFNDVKYVEHAPVGVIIYDEGTGLFDYGLNNSPAYSHKIISIKNDQIVINLVIDIRNISENDIFDIIKTMLSYINRKNVNIFIFNDRKIYYEELLIRYFKNVNIFILSENKFYNDISKIIISNDMLNTVGMYLWVVSSECYYLSRYFRSGERLCLFNKLWFFDLEKYDRKNQWKRNMVYKLILDQDNMGFKRIQPLNKFKQICLLYNKGNCDPDKCNRRHVCMRCGGKHKFVYCIPHNEGCGSNTTCLMNLLSYIDKKC